ncbi:class I SAM-dependent methyltransferase [Hwanghaeella grinnelliae]|uniref:Class I SAM-dependent methyltransferase n=2 Tax=Hwanghaeella grinnelliae TaxID=2500179 RepID=A0A437QZ41_9PROT|nr:class I SAM-dependent methyltransferase [Hwanghaeella grinnelliae]
MTALGHRTGLFDALALRPGVTAEDLAAEAGLAERYVREWLAVMVTSAVIDYDPQTTAYTLPAEHAAFLTRQASPNNMAVTAQFIGVAASVEDAMLARFQSGQGLHYGHFDRFHEVMAEDSAQLAVAALLEHILPIVPGLTLRLTDGIEVVDIGCGAGRAMLRMAEAFPESTFLGLDLCADAFAETEAEAVRRGLSNLRFEARDLSGLSSLGQFDLVTAFDAVHDQKDPQGFLAMVRHSLRPGGVFLMQDIGGSRDLERNLDNPFAPLLYTISLMHCTPISIGQGGPGLGAMWGVETAQEYLAQAGFDTVETHRLPHDPINAYYVARP